MQASLGPDPDAADLAVDMYSADETMRTILDETVVSAEDGQIAESGRTACGSAKNLKDPLARFPAAVDLSSCPRGLAGTWHTHVTTGQLLNPTHSLPDMGNVAFGGLDVSIVSGAESADVLVTSENREEMQEGMRDALGLEVDSTEEIVTALDSGQIPDPPAARDRVRRRLSPLFGTASTGYPDLAQRIEALDRDDRIRASSPGHGLEPMYAMAYLYNEYGGGAAKGEKYQTSRAHPHPHRLREKARRVNHNAPNVASAAGSAVVSSTVGVMTSRIIDRII